MDEELAKEGLTKKERRELRREEREKEDAKNEQRVFWKKNFKIALAALAAAVLGYGGWYLLASRGPKGSDLSRAYEVLPDRNHVSVGATITDYNSNPPTSGRHWPEPAPRGVHQEAKADEQMVHNLEHGEIWISYKPGIPDEAKRELEKITKDFSKVVLTPREKNETDVALAAWGRLDTFNLVEGGRLDAARVKDFITRYRNLGPELVP